MKHIKNILILFLLVNIVLPYNINADSFISIDSSNIMIAKGDSKRINITLNNAAGRLDIITANTNIANIDKQKIFLDNSSEEITIEGINTGRTTINVYTTDVNTYDYQELNNQNYPINVTIYTKGDINNSGEVNIEDVTILLKKYLGVTTLTDEEKIIADINNNNEIDVYDIIEILKIYLNMN